MRSVYAERRAGVSAIQAATGDVRFRLSDRRTGLAKRWASFSKTTTTRYGSRRNPGGSRLDEEPSPAGSALHSDPTRCAGASDSGWDGEHGLDSSSIANRREPASNLKCRALRGRSSLGRATWKWELSEIAREPERTATRSAAIGGGANTHVCRVRTHADAWRASPGVATRHAKCVRHNMLHESCFSPLLCRVPRSLRRFHGLGRCLLH